MLAVRSESFVNDESMPASDNDDVFHFVSYMSIHGALYELDGLQPKPIYLGKYASRRHKYRFGSKYCTVHRSMHRGKLA